MSPHITRQKSATRMWCANVAWSRSRRRSRRCTWIDARGTLWRPSPVRRSQFAHFTALSRALAAKKTLISCVWTSRWSPRNLRGHQVSPTRAPLTRRRPRNRGSLISTRRPTSPRSRRRASGPSSTWGSRRSRRSSPRRRRSAPPSGLGSPAGTRGPARRPGFTTSTRRRGPSRRSCGSTGPLPTPRRGRPIAWRGPRPWSSTRRPNTRARRRASLDRGPSSAAGHVTARGAPRPRRAPRPARKTCARMSIGVPDM